MGRIPSFSAAIALAGAMVATPALADDNTVVLKASSPWNVDYGEEKCRLARIFGTGEDKTLLFMEQWAPDARFGFTVAGPDFKRFKSRRKTQVKFFEGQEAFETEPFTGEVNGFGQAVIHAGFSLEAGAGSVVATGETQNGLPQIETEIARQARYVSLKQGKREVRLDTGPLADPFKVLNECSQLRLAEWGLDVEKHKAIKQMPLWKNEKQVALRIAQTYPTRALQQGESAIIRMRVIVDETGNVTDCKLYDATETDYLRSPACKQMRQAEFDPAIDADGNPIKSFHHTSIIYRVN